MARKDIGRLLSGGLAVLCVCAVFAGQADGQFNVRKVTFDISGSVGQPGVMMKGLPGDPVTGDDGTYKVTVDFGWSGTVTPVKLGYTFEPASRQYAQIASHQQNQDYQASLIKFTVSGTAGLPGVAMKGLPGTPVTGPGGSYTATVDYGWSGTIMPEKEGYTFKPASKTYTQITKDQTNQNYTAEQITFMVSGSVGVDGVVMDGLPNNPVSSPDGTYRAVVPYGWSGTATPKKEGYTFEPASRQYSELTGAQTQQNFTAEAITYTIAGTTGVAGVTMKGLPDDPLTDANGYYVATVKHGFSATVTPVRPGLTFEPASRSYTKVVSSYENQDYAASVVVLAISGNVGQGGVVMRGLPDSPVSDEKGLYTANIEYGWSGTVTPEKEGYTFNPSNRIYSSVTQDQAKQDYKADKITFAVSGIVGTAGVVMEGLPGNPISAGDGSYTAVVPYGWSGTVTPKKAGYTFDPNTRDYTDLAGAQANQDYQAAVIRHVISGTVSSTEGPVEGAFVMADNNGGSGTTDATGGYTLQVEYGWRGKVTPMKEGYTFNPPSRTYEAVRQDQTAQAYTGTVRMFTISGELMIGNTPLQGILVQANNGGGSATTDAKGKFAVKVPYNWTGELLPVKEGLIFDPVSFTEVKNDIKIGEPSPPPPGPTVPPQVGPTVPPEVGPTVPPDVGPTVSPQVGPTVPPQVGPTVPPQVGPTVPPDVGPTTQPPVRIVEGPKPIQTLPPGVTTVVPPTQMPPVPVVEGPLITALFAGTDLREALREIATQSGVAIYVDDTVKPATVSVWLRGVPVESALQAVLQGTGYMYKKIPNSYLVYAPISNTFFDTELRQALADIATSAGVVIIPDEEVTGMVNAELKDVPLETALEIVLAGTGYIVKKAPDYYLVASAEPDKPAFPSVSEIRNVEMNYVKASTAVSMLSTPFRKYAQAEPDTDMVSITAPPALVERIIADLKEIDRKPRHVLLDARVVVMERGDLLNLGIEWGWPSLRAGIFGSDFFDLGDETLRFGGNWPWGVQLGYSPDATFTDSLLLSLNLLTENQQADIVASPQVLAQDGKPATMSVMTEEYYMLTPPGIGTAGFFYSYAEMQKIESGTNLQITPRIGDNDDITLELSVEVSDSIPRGRGSDLPVVTRRRAANTVRVRDGGTVALAGLTESREKVKDKSVPGLSRLPFVGELFKNTERDKATREIAVFITAHLVPEEAALLSQLAEEAPAGAAPAAQPVGEEFQDDLRRSLRQPPN